jgi:hypothetical protein
MRFLTGLYMGWHDASHFTFTEKDILRKINASCSASDKNT